MQSGCLALRFLAHRRIAPVAVSHTSAFRRRPLLVIGEVPDALVPMTAMWNLLAIWASAILIKPRSTIKSHAAERNVPRISELVSLPGTEGAHVRNTKSRSAAQVKAGPPSLSNSGVVSTSMLGPSARCMVRILRQYPHHRSF